MRAAVIGSPIAHSLSPALHRAAYTALGLDWSYEAIEVMPQDFEAFFEQFARSADFAGLSVTMPLKRKALQCANRSTETAALTRVANTLTKVDGAVLADNTDPVGIVFALSRVGIDDLRGQEVAILGAGATAASAVAAFHRLAAERITIYARRPEAVGELVELGSQLGVIVEGRPWGERINPSHAVVVSVVPPGVADSVATDVEAPVGALLDVVYNPWPSKLTSTWASAGGVIADGLDMLVGQACEQVRLMTGQPAPTAAMLAAAQAIRARNPQD